MSYWLVEVISYFLLVFLLFIDQLMFFVDWLFVFLGPSGWLALQSLWSSHQTQGIHYTGHSYAQTTLCSFMWLWDSPCCCFGASKKIWKYKINQFCLQHILALAGWNLRLNYHTFLCSVLPWLKFARPLLCGSNWLMLLCIKQEKIQDYFKNDISLWDVMEVSEMLHLKVFESVAYKELCTCWRQCQFKELPLERFGQRAVGKSPKYLYPQAKLTHLSNHYYGLNKYFNFFHGECAVRHLLRYNLTYNASQGKVLSKLPAG